MHRVNDAGGVLESLLDGQSLKVNFLNFGSCIVFRFSSGSTAVAESGARWVQRPQLGLALEPRREDQRAAKGSNFRNLETVKNFFK